MDFFATIGIDCGIRPFLKRRANTTYPSSAVSGLAVVRNRTDARRKE
jgi:hypothetical protein